LGAAHSASAQQSTFYDDAITLTQQPTGSASNPVSYSGTASDAPYSTYIQLGTTSTSPATPAPALGTYDIQGNSKLALTNGAVVADPPYDNRKKVYTGTLVGARMLYRVYLNGASNQGNYSQLNLVDQGVAPSGGELFTVATNVDFLQGLLGGGTYTIEVIFQIDSKDNATGKVSSTSDPSSSYQATFAVTAPDVTPSGGTTTWQSKSSTDWAVAANWSNGVPTATANAVIPEKVAGVGLVYPVLSDPTYNYVVNNLTLAGTTSSSKSELTISTATLTIYGDLTEDSGGLRGVTIGAQGVADPTKNSTLVFAGVNQLMTGRLSVPDVVIAGSGTKSVISTLLPTNTLSFRPTSVTDGVILQSASRNLNNNNMLETNFNTTGNSLIDLGNSGIINLAAGSAETIASYVKGVLRSSHAVTPGVQEFFGNIGLEMTPNHTPTSDITIFRILGDALTGPVNTGAVPIKRQYQIANDDNSRSSGFSNSSSTIVFHYLPSVDELNGIQEKNLFMFRTESNGIPYTSIPGQLNMAARTFTVPNLPSLNPYTLTLGDRTNPLPVSLVAFTATRSTTNAALSWTTASEQNNTGFEVQVSTDASTFRKLAFVATQDANSNQKLTYSYLDTEASKTGVRYYRLRQIDADGAYSYSPVRALSFDGTTASGLTAYPNPFSDKVDFNLDATAVGTGKAHVQVLDLTGRTVRDQQVAVANASLSLTDLGGLRAGLYVARITLPSGAVQTVRIQKQ